MSLDQIWLPLVQLFLAIDACAEQPFILSPVLPDLLRFGCHVFAGSRLRRDRACSFHEVVEENLLRQAPSTVDRDRDDPHPKERRVHDPRLGKLVKAQRAARVGSQSSDGQGDKDQSEDDRELSAGQEGR